MHVNPAGEVLCLADVLGGVGHLGERREHPARGEPAEHQRQDHATDDHQREDQAQHREHVIDGVQRARELDRDRMAVVLEAGDQERDLAQVAGTDVDVGHVRGAAVGGDGDHVPVDRQRDPALAREHRSIGEHSLDVRGRAARARRDRRQRPLQGPEVPVRDRHRLGTHAASTTAMPTATPAAMPTLRRSVIG